MIAQIASKVGLGPKLFLALLLASVCVNGQLFTASPSILFAAGSDADSVLVGDFNGDGIQDLAVDDGFDRTVIVLLGNGSGGFTAAAGSPIAGGLVAVGDFNGDGNADLVIASTGGYFVLLGNSSGGFNAAPGSPFGSGINLGSVVAADFNGDGNLDLAFVSGVQGDTVAALLGNGLGGFGAALSSPFAGGTTSYSIAVGDFNGDRIPDLAVANSGGNTVAVLLGDGLGGFTAATGSPFAAGSNVGSLAVGDFNGDGKGDLAAASYTDSTVTVLLGNGLGGFTAAIGSPFAAGTYARFVKVGDFNGDGNQDLAVANDFSRAVTVLLGNGSGGFTTAAGSPFGGGTPFSLAVGDFNGDGKPDIVTAGLGIVGTVTVLINTAPAITANPASLVFYGGVGQATPAGIPVNVSSPAGGSTYTAASNQPWLTSNPTSNATGAASSVTLSANQGSLTAGTYSGIVRYTAPGYFDAVTAVTLRLASPSGTLAAAPGSPLAVGSYPSSVAVGDFNGDGKPDLAVANATGGNVTVLLGNGSGGFTAAAGSPFAVGGAVGSLFGVAAYPDSVVVGDFNGDGKLDLATANYLSNDVTVLLGNGSGGFTAAAGSPFPVGSGPLSLAVADYNGDGSADLAVANSNDNDVTVLLGNGSGGFTAAPGSPFAVGTVPASVEVGDFNGDGKPDLVVVNMGSFGPHGYNADGGGFSVTVLLGDGSGGFAATAESPIEVGSVPAAIAVGDFNGDGKQDLAVANGLSYNMTVLLGDGSGGFSAATGSPFAVPAGAGSVVAGDFNGDGIPDLATDGSEDGTLTILLGNGAGGFTVAGSPFAVGSAPGKLATGDFNGDGRLDLAFPNDATAGTLTVLLGAPTPTNSLLSIATSPVTVGTPVPLTLTVSETVTAFAAPTGTATFLDGTTPLGTASQITSPYSFIASALSIGSHTLTATYGGDARTLGSTSNTVTIQVAGPDPQTITFAPVSNQSLGSPAPPLSATASSGLTVTLVSNSPSVCAVSGATVTLIAAGTCSITASQPGNSTYAVAVSVEQTFEVGGIRPVAAFLENFAPALSFNNLTTFPDAGGMVAGALGVTEDLNGNVYVVGMDIVGGVHLNSYNYANSAWNGWQYSGGILDTSSGLTAAVDGDGVVWFTGRDIGDRFWINSWNGSIFGGWVLVADGIFASDSVPQIAIPSDGSIYLIGSDIGGRIWSNSYIPTNQTFTGWVDRQAVTTGQPSATAGQDGMVYVAVRSVSSNSPVYITQIPAQNAPTANTWLNGGGLIDTDPQITSQGGTVYLMAEAGGNSVYLLTFAEASQSFGAWSFTNGILNTATIAAAAGNVYIAGRDNTDRIYWYSVTGNSWFFADGAGDYPTVLTGAK